MNKIFLLFFLCFSFNLSAQTQAEMNKIAHDDFKKADAELNKVYKKVIEVLDVTEKQLMIKAQKDWLKFRDSHCKFEIEQFKGGSISPLIYSTCLSERTNVRIEDLKSILEDKNR
ncbi:lysozyme inhibitor LprI family protein [Flavobacterium bernardetii]|jgi:uncharacterized protein YecT (DUF1311 family)|nr:lysozyme inhibitor LprI family protein [Flavobacterium bernardetii]